MILWIVVASTLLAHLWLTHPDVPPAFPLPLAEFLARIYGAQNAEDVADLETWIGLLLSTAVVSLFTWIGWRVWRRVRHPGEPSAR